MARPLRIEYPDAWYHVMNRGRRYENIFESTQDFHLFLQVVREATDLFGLRVSAYCLMSNHYHLLLQTPNANLARCMRHVNGVYTQRFNRLHGLDGPLFRGRYKAVCVENDRHLLEVMRYIHNNPVKARLVEKHADYAWSSHHGYISKSKKWQWLNSGVLLEMLAEKKVRQKEAYVDFVLEDNSEKIEKFYSMKKLFSVLGSETFKDRIGSLVRSAEHNHEIVRKSLKEFGISADTILRVVGNYYGIDKKTLLSSRRGQTNLPRDIALYLFQRHRHDTLPEIGRYFGLEKYSSVSSGISRAKKAITTAKGVKKDVDIITARILRS